MLSESEINKLLTLKTKTLLTINIIQNMIILYAITKNKKHFQHHKELINDLINKN